MMKMISVKRYTADRVLTQVYFHDQEDLVLDLIFELAQAMVSDFISSNYSSCSFVPVRVDGLRVL